jgi:hypothetical protein
MGLLTFLNFTINIPIRTFRALQSYEYKFMIKLKEIINNKEIIKTMIFENFF